MKKLKLIVGVIVSTFVLSSCSLFSFGGKNDSNSPANSNTGTNSNEGGQLPSGDDLAKEATEFQLLNCDPAIIDAFSEYADMVVEKTNKADAILYNERLTGASLSANAKVSVPHYDSDDDTQPIKEDYNADVSIKNATMNVEVGAANIYSKNPDDVFGYMDVSNLNGNVSGNYHMTDNLGNIPDYVNKDGKFNYTLSDGGLKATYQKQQLFVDISDTHLVSFANTILADTSIIDLKQALGVEQPVNLDFLLELSNGLTTKSFFDIPLPEREVEVGEEEYDVSEGLVQIEKGSIGEFLKALLDEKESEVRPIVQSLINYFHFKTYVYPLTSEYAYGFSISIPNVNSLKELVNYFISLTADSDDSESEVVSENGEVYVTEESSFNGTFDDLLAMVGLNISEFKEESVILCGKDGSIYNKSELSVAASFDLSKATMEDLTISVKKGATATASVSFSGKCEGSVTYPSVEKVLAHKLSENDQKGYTHSCISHDYQSTYTEIDSCHTEYRSVCSVCGHERTSILLNHSYTFVYDASKGKVMRVCKKCQETTEISTSVYSFGSTPKFTLTIDGYFFVFTPTESGYYVFASESKGDTHASLYDSDFQLLKSNDDSGVRNNFALAYQLEAGKTYYLHVGFYGSSSRPIDCELMCLLNQCYEGTHIGEQVVAEKETSPCHYTHTVTCTACGKVISQYNYTSHDVDYENPIARVIDPCHTEYTYVCKKCGEIVDQYEESNHNVDYSNPVVTQISPCVTSYKYVCSTCGEVVDQYEEANHTYKSVTRQIDDDHIGITTTCEKCGDSSTHVAVVIKQQSTAFEISGEETYFAFTPSRSGYYSFKTESESYLDTYGRLYDSNLDVLYSDDDSGGNGNFLLEYKLDANKTYFISANLYGGYNNRSYNCTLTYSFQA